ncbi:MAG: FAD-dependent oxidoreductase [Thermodesulfobacteriota bacterium]
MPYPTLFSPFQLKGLVMPNRILMAAMGNNLSDAQGLLTRRSLEYYLARARGGVGMIITEAVPVSLTARHRASGLCLFLPEHEEGMGRLAEAVHREGGKICIQLNHAGRLADPAVCGGQAVCASALPARPGAAMPRAMSLPEIQQTIADFGRAAQRAVELGFDAIEIHGAHGYLLHQFFSPRANQRQDHFGRDLEGRMHLPLEVAREVLAQVNGRLPVIYRLSAEEYAHGGYGLADSLELGRRLRQSGVELLHVSAGTGDSAASSTYVIQPRALPEACLIPFAEAFRRELGPPVIGVGRIARPELAERLLAEGKIDLVAMGRALLADPEWPRKVQGLAQGPLRQCIGCNRCIEAVTSQKPITCTVNPLAAREAEAALGPAAPRRRVAVVGGGPAGLEAACTAAELGHRVVLLEREDRLGGQLQEASVPPHKDGLADIVAYYQARLAKDGVELFLGQAVEPQTLAGLGVEVVFLATGAQPLRLQFPGSDQANVVGAREALLGRCSLGQRVLVVGGGLVGCETAELLAGQGRQVQVVEMLPELAGEVEVRTRGLLLDRLYQAGVTTFTETTIISLQADEATVKVRGQERRLKADTVVLAVGARAERGLWESLSAGERPCHLIGDCLEPRNILHAVHEGCWVVRRELGGLAGQERKA